MLSEHTDVWTSILSFAICGDAMSANRFHRLKVSYSDFNLKWHSRTNLFDDNFALKLADMQEVSFVLRALFFVQDKTHKMPPQ